jgi:uncharacterized OsmC-like protein
MSTITTKNGTEISDKNCGNGISELSSRSENGIDAVPTSSQPLFVIPRGRGDGFQASIRGHILDLADPSSGHALAPTPDDLFIVSIASECAWSARKFLRAYGLPDDVSVSANWRTTHEDPSSPADINLTVTVSSRPEAMSAALAAAVANSLAARSLAEPVVHISFEGVNR